jgi:hypothetical protein
MTHEKPGWANYGRVARRGAISWYPLMATHARPPGANPEGRAVSEPCKFFKLNAI